MRKEFPSILAVFLLSVAAALADDTADVQAVINEYCRLEPNLTEQAKLMAPDRIMIGPGRRQTDQATNMKVQVANEKVGLQLDPNGQLIVTAVDPIVRIYGDTAVASFYRFWDYVPSAEFVKSMGGNPPSGPPANIVTLVLVKQGGAWKIVHTHMSELHPRN